MTSKFCTLEAVRAQISTEDAFTRDDALIESCIKQATSMVRQFTRRDWTEAEYTDYLDTSDIDVSIRRGRGVYINTLREKNINITDPKYPVLKYSANGRWDDMDAIPRANYAIDVRKNQIILYPGVMDSRPRAIRCTYWAGYPIDATDPELVLVSPALQTATLMQATYMLRRELNAIAGSSRENGAPTMRGYGVSTTGFTREALAILRSEVRIFVGGNT